MELLEERWLGRVYEVVTPPLGLPPVVETPAFVFSYGYDRDRIRRRCRLHKLDDMVDVKSPRCEMMGCRKQPCCGFPGLKPRFCSEHKQDGMLNLKVRCVLPLSVLPWFIGVAPRPMALKWWGRP